MAIATVAGAEADPPRNEAVRMGVPGRPGGNTTCVVVFLLSLDLLVVAPVVATLIGLAASLRFLAVRHEHSMERSSETTTTSIRTTARTRKAPRGGRRAGRSSRPAASARR